MNRLTYVVTLSVSEEGVVRWSIRDPHSPSWVAFSHQDRLDDNNSGGNGQKLTGVLHSRGIDIKVYLGSSALLEGSAGIP